MRRTKLLCAALAACLGALGSSALAQTPAPPPGPESARCLDPAYRCPDLRMAAPYQLRLQRTRGGRRLLRSASAILSLGAGPASLEGRRRDRSSMFVRQRLFTRRGHVSIPRPGARIVFKAIPGQGGYWKFQDAAHMELWTMGPQRRLVRAGEKLVYCLRDLRRTHPLGRSPRHRQFGACSRDPRRQRVVLGTSVGWADIYPAPYYEQYIDVTGLRGCFALWHIADPGNAIIESDETNNAARTIVRLPFEGGAGRC